MRRLHQALKRAGSCAVLVVLGGTLTTTVQAERRFFSARRAPTPTPVSQRTETLPPLELQSSPVLQAPTLPAPALSAPTPAGPTLPKPLPHEALSQRSTTANVVVRVTEEFANRYLSSVQATSGPVEDFVMGAKVCGDQSTQTQVSVDFVPSDSTVKWDVVLQGVTESRTTSTTSQASIEGSGRQQFLLRKLVEFDGRQFTTRSPSATLQSTHCNHQARTRASAIPVIGSITSSIALLAANRYKPLAEQEGARRLTERVGPEFNSNIDERLAQVNAALRQVREQQTEASVLRPEELRCATTDRDLAVQLHLGGTSPLRAAPPIQQAGASLRVHEGAVNAWLDSHTSQRREIAASEIARWLAEFRQGLSLQATPVQEDQAVPGFDPAAATTIVLAPVQPVSVRFIDQQFEIVLRASLRPAIGPELPDQEIVISYRVRHEAEQVLLEPQMTKVQSRSAAGGTVVGDALDTLVRDQIQARLTSLSIPTSIILPAPRTGARLTLQSLSLAEGWLAIDWE